MDLTFAERCSCVGDDSTSGRRTTIPVRLFQPLDVRPFLLSAHLLVPGFRRLVAQWVDNTEHWHVEVLNCVHVQPTDKCKYGGACLVIPGRNPLSMTESCLSVMCGREKISRLDAGSAACRGIPRYKHRMCG